jgi:hypothetical protein
MSQFEFFMAFYGLLLGLGLAELMSGFARFLREKNPPPAGLVTPLLGLLVFTEMLANFVDAWNRLQTIRIDFLPLLVPTVIGLAYYLVAAIIVPRDIDEWGSLDAYFDRRKRWIVGLLLAVNLLIIAATTPPNLLSATLAGDWTRREVTFVLANGWLIGFYLLLLLARRRWLEVLAIAALLSFYPVAYTSLDLGIDPSAFGASGSHG